MSDTRDLQDILTHMTSLVVLARDSVEVGKFADAFRYFDKMREEIAFANKIFRARKADPKFEAWLRNPDFPAAD